MTDEFQRDIPPRTDFAKELLPSVYVVQTAWVCGSIATFFAVAAVLSSPTVVTELPDALTIDILSAPAQSVRIHVGSAIKFQFKSRQGLKDAIQSAGLRFR
jgi:hypothetical protein